MFKFIKEFYQEKGGLHTRVYSLYFTQFYDFLIFLGAYDLICSQVESSRKHTQAESKSLDTVLKSMLIFSQIRAYASADF